jgi:hypothetical protein
MCTPAGPSRRTLAQDSGVSLTTLGRWKLEAGTIRRMSKDDDSKVPEPEFVTPGRSPADKLRLVVEAGALSGEHLGAFLRREGLHEADLDEWREAMVSGLAPARPQSKHGRSVEVRRVRELERELRRKDKALAEAAALLVLQKKVQDLWEDEDDDMKSRSDA